MKILCVIDSLGSGGAQRQLVELARGFKEKGHDVSFLVYHNINFFKEKLDEVNIDVTYIIESNYIKRLLKIRNYIRNEKYDSVLSFLEASNFMCEIAGFPYRKWKLVVGERSSDPKILKVFKLKFYRYFHVFADYVVANSYVNINMVNRINPLLSNNKCKVIYNIIDSTKWKNSPNKIKNSSSRIVMVVAASHQYLKNANGLIEAVNGLPNSYKEKIIINWYGDESPDNSYKENSLKIKEYKLDSIIHFHSATNTIKEKMETADVIGLFSIYEGLPNVICEAMTLGKPLLTSSVSDLPEILKDTKNILFNPNSIEDIKEKLIQLINTKPEELIEIGSTNKKISLELFNKNKILNNYLNLLK